jgi:hypothetical protein
VADGFHDLVTVFQSITLADTLTAQWRARGFTLVVRHEQAAMRGRLQRAPGDRVPSGAGNLVLRAAKLLARELSLPAVPGSRSPSASRRRRAWVAAAPTRPPRSRHCSRCIDGSSRARNESLSRCNSGPTCRSPPPAAQPWDSAAEND